MNMLFFQSEEALNKWLASRKAERGAVLSIAQLWEFSQRWYHDRLLPEFHGRKLEHVQQIFGEFGLISEFWQA